MDFFKTLKKAEWLNLLLSLVFIIIGAILVKDPEGVLKTVSLIAGIVFLVLGFIKIIKYLKKLQKEVFLFYISFISIMSAVFIILPSLVIILLPILPDIFVLTSSFLVLINTSTLKI